MADKPTDEQQAILQRMLNGEVLTWNGRLYTYTIGDEREEVPSDVASTLHRRGWVKPLPRDPLTFWSHFELTELGRGLT